MKVVIASAQKRGGRLESRSIARVPLVATPTSRSATPFDEGEYGTDELIRIPFCSQYSLILPATSSFALSNMTALIVLPVPFSIFAAHTSNSAGASDFALKGSGRQCERGNRTKIYFEKLEQKRFCRDPF